MESGKTTLTAGLVRAGFDYLSDEAVAFDWDTLDIVPYAKPLSIDGLVGAVPGPRAGRSLSERWLQA